MALISFPGNFKTTFSATPWPRKVHALLFRGTKLRGRGGGLGNGGGNPDILTRPENAVEIVEGTTDGAEFST